MYMSQYLPLYRLKDYDKAIMLHASGVVLDGVEWNDSGDEANFVFESESDCLSILKKHDRHLLKIDSHRWAESRREINSALYRR